jgi:hypothetical protein
MADRVWRPLLKQGDQRAILNFTPGHQGWNLSPREMFTPLCSSSPGMNTLEEQRGEQNFKPRG